MLNLFRLTIVILSLLTLNCCNKEPDLKIPNTVEIFVESFFNDANFYGRNISIEDQDLIISFGRIEEPLIDGRCNSNNNNILIDSLSWKNKSTSQKKWLIYHELGHCVLNRGHTDNAFINGECKSLMHSNISESNCSTNFISTSWFDYYSKELFTSDKESPDWYKSYLDYDSINYLTYNVIDTTINEDRLNFICQPELLFQNFQFEIVYNNWQEIESCLHFKWGDGNSIVVCEGNNMDVRKSNTQNNSVSTEYYYRNNLSKELDQSTKISLRKIDGYYFIYVDEILYHIMDESILTTPIFSTNSIDGVMDLQIKYGEINPL